MATKDAPKKKVKKKSAPKPIFIVDRSNVLGWILAGFLGCGLMFVLGVLVGRNQAPIHFDMKRLDEKLANLKQSVLTTKIKPFDVIGNLKNDGVPDLQEHDPRTVAPRYAKKDVGDATVSPEMLAPETDKAEPETNPVESEIETSTEASYEESPEPAVSSEPEPTKRQEPTPVKKPALPEHRRSAAVEPASPEYARIEGFAIQIASLSDPESAAMVRDRFLSKGYPAYVRKADVNGKTFHRVRIGPYPNKEKAQKDLTNLTDAGVSGMIFLAEDANP